jgi:UDPglucose 6-dehydrogenase
LQARFAAKENTMRIAMIGAGYVGLVSGACFAEFGVDVTVMDVDPAKIAALHEGRMPIYEPGLDKLVAENVAAGRLGFTTDLTTDLTRGWSNEREREGALA